LAKDAPNCLRRVRGGLNRIPFPFKQGFDIPQKLYQLQWCSNPLGWGV